MKKIVFMNFPAEGHMNPSIELCNQLGKKGVKVVYYTLKKDFYRFQGIENLELRSYPEEFMPVIDYFGRKADKLAKNLIKAIHMVYYCTRELIDFSIKEIQKEKPDLVINDIFAVWGKMAARYCKIPMVIFSSGFLADTSGKMDPGILKLLITSIPTLIKALSLRKQLMTKYNVKCDSPIEVASDQGEYTVVVSTKKLQPGSQNLGSNVKFIGSNKGVKEFADSERDTIFISLGTLCENKTFWNRCLEATKDLGYKVILVLGSNSAENINKELINENVTIHTKVPYVEYEKYIAKSLLFINHGGLNSVSLSILYKTPVLVCPDSFERYVNGLAVANNNCGKTFKSQKFTASELQTTIKSILSDKHIRTSLEECSKDFQNSMGYDKVADDIITTFQLEA